MHGTTLEELHVGLFFTLGLSLIAESFFRVLSTIPNDST